jgi:hypothetical protein
VLTYQPFLDPEASSMVKPLAPGDTVLTHQASSIWECVPCDSPATTPHTQGINTPTEAQPRGTSGHRCYLFVRQLE